MRSYFSIILLIIIVGCTKPAKVERSVDTIAPISLGSGSEFHVDNWSFVGYVDKFINNDSLLYASLYFVEGFNQGQFDRIATSGQVVYQDDEFTRTKLELDKVAKYFDLRGVHEVDFYNQRNEKLTSGKLSHIEYIEDLLEGKFVAVFVPEIINTPEALFCITKGSDLDKIEYTQYDDNVLSARLVELLQLHNDHVWKLANYRLKNRTISCISADTTAYIVESNGNSFNVLYKSKTSEIIHDLTFTSAQINDQYLILTNSGVPETDMMWSSLLLFNGKEYEVSKAQRVQRKN